MNKLGQALVGCGMLLLLPVMVILGLWLLCLGPLGWIAGIAGLLLVALVMSAVGR